MSFIPQTSSKAAQRENAEGDEYSGGSFGRNRDREREQRLGIERVGAGLEKRKGGAGGGAGGDDGAEALKGDDRMGRTSRRHIERSGSKNAFRRR